MKKMMATAASDATDTAISARWNWGVAVNAGAGTAGFRRPRKSGVTTVNMTPNPHTNVRKKPRRIRNGSSSIIASHTIDVLIASMTIGT